MFLFINLPLLDISTDFFLFISAQLNPKYWQTLNKCFSLSSVIPIATDHQTLVTSWYV